MPILKNSKINKTRKKEILKIKIRINNTKRKAIAKRMCKSKSHFLEKGHINGESPQESDEGKERLKIRKI